MKKMFKIIVIVNVILTVFSLALAVSTWKSCKEVRLDVVACVPTISEAIEIAKVVCEVVYPQYNYSEYFWDGYYNPAEQTWNIYCSEDLNSSTLDGELPEVIIKKSNGEIVYVGL